MRAQSSMLTHIVVCLAPAAMELRFCYFKLTLVEELLGRVGVELVDSLFLPPLSRSRSLDLARSLALPLPPNFLMVSLSLARCLSLSLARCLSLSLSLSLSFSLSLDSLSLTLSVTTFRAKFFDSLRAL